ncbi:MAG: GTP-binding protein [Alphaproteobacteria bacterium]|nr:MAG: GTP-binding protein [Alphaproteobacteria bacterium]TMK43543.1 MAG: GTP-binding protein [Alphaproteobacteria bacterium]
MHMLVGGAPQRLWKLNEKRDSSFVFICRGLPKDRLKHEFESCRV